MNLKSPYLLSFILAGLLLVLSLALQNNEFLLYAVTVIALVTVIYKTDQYFAFPRLGLWLFNLWLILHILGGLASYRDTRFYDLILVDLVGAPYHVLKYDQFVHFYCYVVIAMLMWRVVQKIARPDANRTVICVVNVLAASSLGALNEVIEFSAVVLLDSDGVGGYTNTAIDLVANLLGAIVGTFYMQRTQSQS